MVRHIEWISKENGSLNGYQNLWICLFMDRNFSEDIQLITLIFKLSRLLLNALLVPLPDMSIDEQLNIIRHDYPYSPDRLPIPNKIELEGLGCTDRPRKMLFCITKGVFFHFELGVVCLFVDMRDDVNNMHFFAA